MKSKINADKIIALIKSRHGIERKQICDVLGLSEGQFNGAQPYVKQHCYRQTKKWYVTVVEVVPPRIRKSPTATIIYNMMPVGQMGLKERMGMHKDAIRRALKLLTEHRLIHITGYETNNTTIFPIFAAGKGIDAIRPDSRTLANQRSYKYKSKNLEAVRQKHIAYRLKNTDLLREKARARYAAKSDAINAIARAKRAMPKAAPKPIATQWRTATPWVEVRA